MIKCTPFYITLNILQKLVFCVKNYHYNYFHMILNLIYSQASEVIIFTQWLIYKLLEITKDLFLITTLANLSNVSFQGQMR
jgi:hypothetical protein